MGQWFIRYLHPSEAGWKQIVDHFILYDKHGELRYTERRSIVISKLAPYDGRNPENGKVPAKMPLSLLEFQAKTGPNGKQREPGWVHAVMAKPFFRRTSRMEEEIVYGA